MTVTWPRTPCRHGQIRAAVPGCAARLRRSRRKRMLDPGQARGVRFVW
jgi:hypothetical protein